MSSFTRSFTHSDLLTKQRIKDVLIPFFILFLLAPAVFQLETWLLQKMEVFQEQRLLPRRMPSREVNQYAARLSAVNLQLMRNPRIRMVKVGVPYKIHAMGSMLAVSRTAKPLLEANRISYIDPTSLSEKEKVAVRAPFDVATINNYILIEDARNGLF